MGRPRSWATDQTGRAPMRSPGRPGVNQQDSKRAFWAHIAAGLSSEDAASACGVSQPVGTRWFREAGGMAPISLLPPSGRYLSFAEREELALLRVQGCGVREMARRLGRSPSTVSRELRRNAATRVAVAAWIAKARLTSDGYLFPSRQHASPHLSVRQHARIVKHWVVTYE